MSGVGDDDWCLGLPDSPRSPRLLNAISKLYLPISAVADGLVTDSATVVRRARERGVDLWCFQGLGLVAVDRRQIARLA